MVEEFIPTLTHATERDIDLLLVEEIFSSPKFLRWLADKAGLQGDIASSTVLHSKRRTRNRREIDIFVDLTMSAGKRAALLIENKLDASEQPDQAESYREELNVLAGDFTQTAMLIVCPADYSLQHQEFTSKFDAVVTYQQLVGYFRIAADELVDNKARMRFRADVIEQAIHKHRRGYTPVPNEIIGDFNARYVALLGEIAPEIKPGPTMLKQANPDESVSMIYDARKSFSTLPKDVCPTRFAHELGRGQSHRANYVAVTFGGWGVALKELKEMLTTDTEQISAQFAAKPPTKNRPNPGLVMSVTTDAIDNQADFDEQGSLIESGIREAAKLRKWLLDNQAILYKWQRKVREAAS